MNKVKYLLLLILSWGLRWAEAHSLPNSQANLLVNERRVIIQFQTPLEILELATKQSINLAQSSTIDNLKNYYLRHISVRDSLHSTWKISVGKIFTQATLDSTFGNVQEVVAEIFLEPSNRNSLRNFVLSCDLIIHQIPNQSILFSIKQDWQNGIAGDNFKQVGVIALDIPTWKVLPLHIRLENGNAWKGFKNMMTLGMKHIKEGTDHLLFLLVLLLPAMLLVNQTPLNKKSWGGFGGIKYSFWHLFKIVSAFTIGHSVTLLIGALGWVKLPSQPIEVLIAISILISAFHAIRPLFPEKEPYVAAGFGLVHGLAFANILTALQLSTTEMALSILGFNIGIEAMQLFIIALIVPWLILLSRTSFYSMVRIGGAIFSIIVALAWTIERVSGTPNAITTLMQNLSSSF